MATGLVLDSTFKRHAPGPEHPERPERLDAISAGLSEAGLTNRLSRIALREAKEDELALCHSREYIGIAKRDIMRGLRDLSTGDTQVSRDSYEVALQAAGAVLNAVDGVMDGRLKNAFCAVRPPGHHATPVRGMGFCIFNNIAVAARYAQKRHGAQRVLIVDWDVHHGNGTQDAFYQDASVFFFSTHQWPLYPGTGAATEVGDGDGRGTTMNRPFPAGSRREIIDAFREDLLPAARRFKPDVVMISAGFDSRRGDPLGSFQLTDEDFAELTRMMMDLAEEHAGGRVVSVLEGGYSLSGLAAGVAAHVSTLSTA